MCYALLDDTALSLLVVRLVEEVKEKCGGVALTNEDVYMSTTYSDFVKITVLKSRGVSLKKPFTYDAVSICTFHVLLVFIETVYK